MRRNVSQGALIMTVVELHFKTYEPTNQWNAVMQSGDTKEDETAFKSKKVWIMNMKLTVGILKCQNPKQLVLQLLQNVYL